jgi:hypothetical protein
MAHLTLNFYFHHGSLPNHGHIGNPLLFQLFLQVFCMHKILLHRDYEFFHSYVLPE